ncbi:MAG: Rrf2 family transcriptional regulator [Phycisphaerales bacterium]|nr:Rrf2 family transcriptional regulator [Phycisphaerales bacterium]
MKLSKRIEYGLKACVALVRNHGRGYRQAREIALSESLPGKFLESILLSLRSGGVLTSKVGSGGGYRLARAPHDVRLSEVLAILTNAEEDERPLARGPRPRTPRADGVGLALPSSLGDAALHVVNERITQAMSDAVGSISLADLVHSAEKKAGNGHSAMYHI